MRTSIEVPPGSGSLTEYFVFTPRAGGGLVAEDTAFIFFADGIVDNLQEQESNAILAGDTISLITDGEVIPGYSLLITVVRVGHSLHEEETLQEILDALEDIYGVSP